MKKIGLIISCICFFLFLSCRKEATVKLPETKPLPVMYSYICPDDSVIRLKLMYSSPLYSSNQIDVLAAVPDGDVKISSAQGTAQLIYNTLTQYYELKTNSFPILAGQVYKMTVTTVKGDVAAAETQVPITSVLINTVTVEPFQENYGTIDRVKVSFTDEPGVVNYYRIAALYARGQIFSGGDTLLGTEDANINELYSDINNDGGSVFLDGTSYRGRNDSTLFFSMEYYDVFLYNCSPSYFNFHKSLRNYSGDNPFTEPTLIYSNVKGGFGCFGAYVRSSFRYKKK